MDTKQMSNEQLTMSKVRRGFPRKFFLFFSFFILNSSFVLFAQNPGYSLDTSGEEPRFTQRLSWIGEGYVSRYEVILEKEEGRSYRELWRVFTTELFIEVSLAPGKYRCYAIPYDFLGQPGERSEMYIEVLAAILPVLNDSPAEFVYPDKTSVYEMNFSGKNISPNAEIYMRGPYGGRIIPSEVHVREDGSEVQLLFDKHQLPSGNYELIVKNPGGLEANKRGITVTLSPTGHSKKLDLFLGVAWMPSVTIYDKGNRFFDDVWSLGGGVFRLGIVFAKPAVINMGVELTEAISVIYDSSAGREIHIDPTLSFLLQKRLSDEKTILTFRLGIGFSLPQFSNDEYSPPFSELFYTNVGVSLLGFVWNDVYLEGGIDYAHWFSSPFSGNFRPWFGIGMRF